MKEELLAIRDKNFGERKRQTPVLRANEKYLNYLSQVEGMVEGQPDKRTILDDSFSKLELEVRELEENLAREPNNQELIQTHREKTALRDMTFKILISTQQGGDIGATIDNMKIKPLTSMRQARSYDAILEEYAGKGIVIYANRSNFLDVMERLNDYQIVVCERDLVIPSPLSMVFFKNPQLTRSDAIDKLVQYAADYRMRKKHGKDEKGHFIDTSYARLYGSGSLKNEAERLLRNSDLVKIAEDVTSDLPQFDSLHILSDNVIKHLIGDYNKLSRYVEDTPIGYSRKLFNDNNISPENALRAAIELMHPHQEYLTLHWFGFEPETPLKRMMALKQNEIGMKMYLYIQMKREAIGSVVPIEDIINISITDIIRPTKVYAGGVEGPVFSRSRKGKNHEIKEPYLPIFPKGIEADMSKWTDIDVSCPCEHAIFVSTLHGRQFVYLDAHAVALALDTDYRHLQLGDIVLNLVCMPTPSMNEINRKVDEQLLVRNKINREVRMPNRAEQTWYSMQYLKQKGYDICLTTNLNQDFSYILAK